jgi:hypothetical protein
VHPKSASDLQSLAAQAGALQTRDEREQRIFPDWRQRCLSRTAIVTIATPYDEAVILHATNHFAKRFGKLNGHSTKM